MKVLVMTVLLAVSGLADEVKENNDQVFSHYAVLLPTSANTAGAFGAYFSTRLTIVNPSLNAFPVEVSLGSTNGLVGNRTLSVSPGWETWDNFLGTVFGFTGAGGLVFASREQSNKFIVEAEVYTDSASGRYTTPIPSFEIVSGSTDVTWRAVVAGVNVNSRSRLNLGCFNSSGSFRTAVASVRDAFLSPLELKTFLLPAFGWSQLSVSTNVNNGVVNWLPMSPEITCYAVSVDNRSNDGTLRLASFLIP